MSTFPKGGASEAMDRGKYCALPRATTARAGFGYASSVRRAFLFLVLLSGCGGAVSGLGADEDATLDGTTLDSSSDGSSEGSLSDGTSDSTTDSGATSIDSGPIDGTAPSDAIKPEAPPTDGGCTASPPIGKCYGCAFDLCCKELVACEAEPKCKGAMKPFFACLETAPSEPTADKCDTTFSTTAAGSVTTALINCVHDSSCKTVCH